MDKMTYLTHTHTHTLSLSFSVFLSVSLSVSFPLPFSIAIQTPYSFGAFSLPVIVLVTTRGSPSVFALGLTPGTRMH